MAAREGITSGSEREAVASQRQRSASLRTVKSSLRWARRTLLTTLFVIAISIVVLDVWSRSDNKPISESRRRWIITPGKVEPARVASEYYVAGCSEGKLIYCSVKLWSSGNLMYQPWESATKEGPSWRWALKREVSWGNELNWPSYFKWVRWYSRTAALKRSGRDVRGLALPCPLIASIFGTWPVVSSGFWVLRRLRLRRRRASNCCPECGYDLRGGIGGCPECGLGRVDISDAHTLGARPLVGEQNVQSTDFSNSLEPPGRPGKVLSPSNRSSL